MKACVTGGAGFIGSHLVERLLREGHEVVVLDDLSTGRREHLDAGVSRLRVQVGDVRDASAVAEAVAGADVVFHLAAIASVARSVDDPELVSDVNLQGTIRVLEACRAGGVRRFVLASSSAVYGEGQALPIREDAELRPASPYAASKLAAEAYAAAYAGSYPVETVSLRFFNVYGPRQPLDGQYGAVIPLFIEAMRSGREPVLHGDGSQTRDFTYVEDVVDAIVRAGSTDDLPPGPCNLGAGVETAVRALADEIAQLVDYAGPVRESAPRSGDLRHSVACCERIEQWLGWRAATSLREGLRATIAVGA